MNKYFNQTKRDENMSFFMPINGCLGYIETNFKGTLCLTMEYLIRNTTGSGI